MLQRKFLPNSLFSKPYRNIFFVGQKFEDCKQTADNQLDQVAPKEIEFNAKLKILLVLHCFISDKTAVTFAKFFFDDPVDSVN